MSQILDQLTPLGDAAKAADMQRYHKTDRTTLGVSNPQIDDAVRSFRADTTIDDWIPEATALWTSGVFEARIAAPKLLTKARLPKRETEVWQLLSSWVPDFDGWAIADHVASAAGRRLMTDLDRLGEMEPWTTSDHMWTRRAALIFAMPLTKSNHPSPPEQAARQTVLGWAATYTTDHDWFIQKAIGWWLRSLSIHDPDPVRAFIDAHGAAMKPFARREALRKLKD